MIDKTIQTILKIINKKALRDSKKFIKEKGRDLEKELREYKSYVWIPGGSSLCDLMNKISCINFQIPKESIVQVLNCLQMRGYIFHQSSHGIVSITCTGYKELGNWQI